MLVVTIELWPWGDKTKSRVLGQATITNIGGSKETGHYRAQVTKFDGTGETWKTASVSHFPRLRLGPWDLLYRALRDAVGSRNDPGKL